MARSAEKLVEKLWRGGRSVWNSTMKPRWQQLRCGNSSNGDESNQEAAVAVGPTGKRPPEHRTVLGSHGGRLAHVIGWREIFKR